jgi:hypothetical protein
MATLTRAQRVALKTWNPANLRRLFAAAQKANPGFQLPATGMAPNVGGFTPFAAPKRPPPGTYDPALDAQERATGRGYEDLVQDYGVAKGRAQDDFLLDKGTLQTELDRALGDAGTGRGRQREDYTRAIADLTRQYATLGGQQEERANAAGLFQGGALEQALRKRTANMALDRAPMDIADQRAEMDFRTLVGSGGAGGRLREDFGTRVGRMGTTLDRQFGEQGDQTIALARAGREKNEQGVDIGAQRWFQATQAGYDPPVRPKAQRGSGTNPYKVVRTPRGSRRLFHTGYLVSRR